MENFYNFVVRVATVALIVFATRWLFSAKGAQLPISRGDARVYGIKWHIRAVGYICAVFSVAIAMLSRPDLASLFGWISFIIQSAVTIAALWLATGSVSTNQDGIAKKFLWSSRSLRWDEITEIHSDGKQIELLAGSKRLNIDLRFVAMEYLLNEIISHTKIQPTMK